MVQTSDCLQFVLQTSNMIITTRQMRNSGSLAPDAVVKVEVFLSQLRLGTQRQVNLNLTVLHCSRRQFLLTLSKILA